MKYKKIARKRGVMTWQTLWMGDDHLLRVDSTGYSEDYSRFYFKEIQAIVSRRTKSGPVVNGLMGGLALIGLLVGISQRGDDGALGAAIVWAGFFLFLMLLNIFRGPTCRCHLLTPLGIEEIRALNRLKRVKKLLDRLHPILAVVQGELSSEEIVRLASAVRQRPSVAPAPSAPRMAHDTAAAVPAVSAKAYNGWLHRVAFLFLILDAGVTTLQMIHNTKVIILLSALFTLGFIASAIAALVKEGDHPISPVAKRMTWLGIATIVASSIIGYCFTIFFTFSRLTGNNPPPDLNNPLELYASIQPSQHPSFSFFLLAYALIAAAIAVIGLIGTGSRPAPGRRK